MRVKCENRVYLRPDTNPRLSIRTQVRTGFEQVSSKAATSWIVPHVDVPAANHRRSSGIEAA